MSIELLYQRRSIRKYLNKPVEDEKVKELLKAGMAAPSAMNKQPWHFAVIRNQDILNCITKIHPYSSMLVEAPLGIAVCGNKNERYWVQDCSAAMQNILLAAVGLNLGSVWLGVYPDEERTHQIKKLLNLKDPFLPLGICAVGYPNETKPLKDHFDESKVSYID